MKTKANEKPDKIPTLDDMQESSVQLSLTQDNTSSKKRQQGKRKQYMDKARIREDVELNEENISLDNMVSVKQPMEQKLDSNYVKKYPYKVNVNYLTQAETKLMQELLKYLRNKVGDRVILGIKSRVADIVQLDDVLIDAYKLDKYSALRAIAEKHIDFTVVDVTKGVVICCIELDDVYHNRYDNIQKDIFKDEIFRECGIPLFRIKTKIANLDPEQDFRRIYEETLQYFAPTCPNCGNPMVVKQDRFGQRFYACIDNQKCRRTIQID